MSWFDDVLDGASSVWSSGVDFLDDVVNVGAGGLESVGESLGGLNAAFGYNNSANPNTTQQPSHPVYDNHGNTVTTPQGATAVAPKDNTMLFAVGGGVVLLVVIMLFAFSQKG
ncbi:hypothetical protein [Enterovibrio calviensis]|uniref:hypothetical protein n=1 Tax=Enterovibrio calviensis TaxID=91359 RepID=UPI000688E801|nr:hypothetical protein [Enterovibrio calviensis]